MAYKTPIASSIRTVIANGNFSDRITTEHARKDSNRITTEYARKDSNLGTLFGNATDDEGSEMERNA